MDEVALISTSFLGRRHSRKQSHPTFWKPGPSLSELALEDLTLGGTLQVLEKDSVDRSMSPTPSDGQRALKGKSFGRDT